MVAPKRRIQMITLTHIPAQYQSLCYGTLRYSSGGIAVGLVDWGGISGIVLLLLAVGF